MDMREYRCSGRHGVAEKIDVLPARRTNDIRQDVYKRQVLGIVRGKRRHEVQPLGERGVKTLDAQDAVHTLSLIHIFRFLAKGVEPLELIVDEGLERADI